MKKFAFTSLSSRIWLILLLALILASLTTFLTAAATGYYYINQIFNDKVDTIFTSIENELVIFDHALTLVEEDWDKELTHNLPKLAQKFTEGKYSATEKTPEYLKKIAREHGLTDLYLIDNNLVVIASSFKPDIGLDMSKFSSEYTKYLKDLLNQGETGIDRINVSSETGILKKYAYYSSPGSDLIINVDIGVYDRIKRGGKKANLVRILYEDITQQFKANRSDIIDIDVFNISQADQWSLFTEGRKLSRNLADRLYSGEQVKIEEPGKITLFSKAPFSRYEDMGFKVFTMIVLDQSSRSTLLFNALFFTISGTLILVLMIWLISYILLQKLLTKRLNNLMLQIGQLSGTKNERIDIGGTDEITQIGETINKVLNRIEQEEKKKNLFENLSHTDSLTRVANRRKLNEVLESESYRVSRGLGNLCVMMIDVDWFKDYNDFYGHLAGDEALKTVASILINSMQRPSDLVARFGGEEFICIIPGSDSGSGKELAANIVERVFQTQIPHDKSPLKFLSVSLGCLYIANHQSCTAELVIQQVDDLLYKSKSAGKNQFTCHEYISELRN